MIVLFVSRHTTATRPSQNYRYKGSYVSGFRDPYVSATSPPTLRTSSLHRGCPTAKGLFKRNVVPEAMLGAAEHGDVI